MPARGRSLLKATILCSLLFAPSIWMVATIPPLWRDADAYHQLMQSPGQSTLEGHGPLYGIAVRLPLYLGYRIEHLDHLQLSDTGILLLICAQHLALGSGAFALIVLAARTFWCRLVLAMFFASNSIFYTFAHCVGSESLSLVCVLALSVVGLRLLQAEDKDRRKWWFLFGLILFACVLTRYANSLLILVVPLSFLLLAWPGRSLAPLRQAGIALAIGLLCLGLARLTAELLCQSAGHRYYSRAGFTFLWRLHFLDDVSVPRRSALLDQVSDRASSTEARDVISCLRQMLEAGETLSPVPIYHRVRAALATPEKRLSLRRFHMALNATARAFLLPPTREHWQAGKRDFARALEVRMPLVSATLFATTVFCFEHHDDMPELATLATFRDRNAGELMAVPGTRIYFRATNFLSLGGAVLLWLILAAGLLFIKRQARQDLRPIFFYGLALTLGGVLILVATALMADLSPRYTLPLWALSWFSGIIYAGAIGDALVRRNEQPAGQRDAG